MKWFYYNFDEDGVRCMLCNGECDITSIAPMPDIYHKNKYTCRDCKEHFTIFVFANELYGKNIGQLFRFSFKGFVVSLSHEEGCFAISKDDSVPFNVPKFEIDLTDQNKLLRKLRTYILFS
jgi:hypothetical protein